MKILASVIGTLILALLIGSEIQHDILSSEPWPGFDLVSNRIVYLLTPIWLIGIASFWVKKEWAYFGLFGAIFATFAHGLVVTVGATAQGDPSPGRIFVLAALALGFLEWASKRGDLAGANAETPLTERPAA